MANQQETLSRHRKIQIDWLYLENVEEIEMRLKQTKYKYRGTGAEYEGTMLGGLRHGKGTMKFQDGASY